MSRKTEDLIKDARLIIKFHNLGFNSDLALEVYQLHQEAMKTTGYDKDWHTEDEWDSYISKLPKELRAVMIELDDCADVHNTTRYV